MVAFWKYGISVRVCGLFVYAGYNPDSPVLFNELYGAQKVCRCGGLIFKARKLKVKTQHHSIKAE